MTLMAVAPINAPTRTREALRIIACLSGVFGGPPWSGIDRLSVFSKFNVKRWSVCFQRQCSRTGDSFRTHHRKRFAGENKLALPRVHGLHSGENQVISVAGIENDHLPVAAKRAG